MRGSIVKRGASYRIMFRAPDPATGRIRQFTRTYATKRAAEEGLKDAVREVDEHRFTPASKQTLKEFLEEDWLPSLSAQVAGGSMKRTTETFYANLARSYVIPHIGGVVLPRLDAPALNRLYGELLAGGGKDGGALSTTTVHSVHVAISRALKDAMRWGKLTRNVASMADAPAPAESRKQWWTAAQLRQFAEAVASDRLSGLWTLAMTTGLRRGELAGLRWIDVDLEAGRLTVASTRVVVGYEVVTATPKTKKSARTIALDPVTVTALRSHRRRQLEERVALGEAWTDSGLVFTYETGEGLHPERLLRVFQAATKRAGLPPIPLHGLRHSYASAGLSAGISMKVMQERLGHSSIAITADLYSHIAPEVDQDAADRTAAWIFGSR